MNPAKRNIRDYFSPSAKKRKNIEYHQNSNEDCTAVTTNANNDGKHSALEEAAKESSGNKKLKTVDMPVLKSNEEDLFPVSLSDFQKYTNVTDLVILDIKKAKPHSFEQYINNKKYVAGNTHKFYTIFYAKPKYRKKMGDLKLLSGCPKEVEKRIFNIPEAFQKKKLKHKNKEKEDSTKENEDVVNPKPGTSKSAMSQLPINDSSQTNSLQTVANSYPVSFKEFHKFVNFDEDFNQYLFNLCNGDATEIEKHHQMRNVRLDFDYNFYKKFYAIPCVRHKLKWKFKPCPQAMKDKILLRACCTNEMNRPSDNATNGDNYNKKNQCSSMVNMAVLEGNEEELLTASLNDTSQEISIKSYPVSLKQFKKFVNFDEDYEHYLSNLCRKDAKKIEKYRQMSDLRLEFDNKFYKKFYAIPSERHKLKWKFRPCPQKIKDKILSNAEMSDSTENATKNFETNNNATKKDSEENQFANIINLPTLGNEEIKLFPIKFCLFLEKTNVLDIVDEAVPLSRQGNMQYIKEIAYKFFIAFYTKPELRRRKPLNAIKCSPNLEYELFQIPAKYQINKLSEDKPDNQEVETVQTSKETEASVAVSVYQEDKVHKQADDHCLQTTLPADNLLPTNESINLLKLFKKYINYDEIIDEIFMEAAKNNPQTFQKLQKDVELRSRALRNYYEAFYKKPEIRERYKFNMKPCPLSISKLILQIPERDCFTVGNREEDNSIQQRKRSVAELDHYPEEMPQLKKQRTFRKPEVKLDSSKASVINSVGNMKEIHQNDQHNTLSSATSLKRSLCELQNSNTKNVHFSNFAANLSEDFFKKYLAVKSKNCCTEEMQSQLVQRINERILKEKSLSPKSAAKKKLHIQSVEVIKPPDNYQVSNKHFTLANAARISEGLKQRILLAILNMSFDEFIKYTRLREPYLNENEKTLELYNTAIAVEELWHPSLYMSLLDLQEYLSSKGIVISDTDFQHISPIILSCEEIALITNFDDIVRLDYYKETSTIIKDEDLLGKRRIHFYNKCMVHNQWICKTPVLGRDWKTILQHNTAAYMPKLIVTPRTSSGTDSEKCISEASAKEINFNKDDLDTNETNAANVIRCEATLSMESHQHLDTAMQASELISDSEIHPIVAENSLQHIILSGSDEIQKTLAVSGQKLLTENEPVENKSLDFFLSRSSKSNKNCAVRFSQDVLLSSASSEMISSPSATDLFYLHLVKTPSKFTSTQESKTQKKSTNSTNKKIQFHATNTSPKTALPLSPNIFVSSSGSTISQQHSQNLLQQNTIADSPTELNDNPILVESSLQNKDVEFFVDMPNTQNQILSLPSDEHLSYDPLDDEIEQQLNDLFGEDAATTVLNQCILSPEQNTQEVLNNLITNVTEGITSKETNSNLFVEENNEKATTLQPVIEKISNAEIEDVSSEEIIPQALNETAVNQTNENLTGAQKQLVPLPTSTELNNETNKATESQNKILEVEVNIESAKDLTSETASAIVISNDRSEQPKEANCSHVAENSLDFSVGDSHTTVLEIKKSEDEVNIESITDLPSKTTSAIVVSNVRPEQPKEKSSSQAAKDSQYISVDSTHVTDDKYFKKEIELPNRLQFTLNDTENSMIIETMEENIITISDDDDKNDEESQPKLADGQIKQEIQFLNNLLFTINDSNSAPQICNLQSSPPIVLDDNDCNTALIEQLMNPTDESSSKGAGISKISSEINDDETGTFCEAQKLPSSIEDSDTVQENQRQQQLNPTFIPENDDNKPESINTVPAVSDNIGSFDSIFATDQDYAQQQNVEIFVEMSDNGSSLQSSEELVLEFNIPTTESPEQEPINLYTEQHLNIDINSPAEPQVPEDDSVATAKINVESQNLNVISNATKTKKVTETKRKQTKNINNTDVIPQILHTFRPLEVAAVTKTYENKRRSKSPNVDQQENTPTPSQITTAEPNNSNNSSGATKSFSASQALATDCTLFNNTELLKDLEKIQYKPEEVIAANVQGTSTSSVASLISSISTASYVSVSEQGVNES